MLRTAPLTGSKRLQPLRALAIDEQPSPQGFWSLRWHGGLPLSQIFWRDMLVMGTLLNFVFLFFTLMLYAQRADPILAMAVHLAVLPLNLFLVASVWRHHQAHSGFKAAAALWLGMTFLA